MPQSVVLHGRGIAPLDGTDTHTGRPPVPPTTTAKEIRIVNDWITDVLDRLSEAPVSSYGTGMSPASEPTALAAMALASYGKCTEAAVALDWLVSIQTVEGSVGISAAEWQPRWPTSLAVLAWCTARHYSETNDRYDKSLRAAVQWLIRTRSKPQETNELIGHDTMLIGWPWMHGTHAWVQPTALAVMALKATSNGDNPRAREGIRILEDRQLPHGGWNYGNTIVLGHELRPHLEPSGMTLLALAGEPNAPAAFESSFRFVRESLSAGTPTASLCYCLMGLAAHGQEPAESQAWLTAAYGRTAARHSSGAKFALLALAAAGKSCPLVDLLVNPLRYEVQ